MDSQNTIAGTSTGANLTNSSGNWFLNGLSDLTSVGAKISDVYSSFKDAEAVRDASNAQQVTPPAQTTPSFQVTNAADFFSDPARVKRAGFYAVFGTLAIGSLIYIAKRA